MAQTSPMLVWLNLAIHMPAHTLPITLRQMRKAGQLSHLELPLRLGVSQRHVSFVESSRAQSERV